MDNDISGQTIKGYDLRECIGAGGFGAVYHAYQPLLKREVAIKVILPQYANQPDFIRRFEVEAELVARLEHPHIVPLFDYWREPDGAFLVMRLLRGGSLRKALERGPMDVNTVARMMEQITGALAIAHRNGVVHRDIKPDNILLDEDGNVYLTDFGIAKILGVETSDEDAVSGTLTYMAPEQFTGLPITPQTDIYSLGVVLYELLTGELPFSPREAIHKHLHESLPKLQDVKPDLPESLNEVIQVATAKAPDERYRDVLRLASAYRVAIAREQAGMLEDFLEEVEIDNPYKGLRAFQEADSGDFFGREDLTERILQRLSNDDEAYYRFLAVVGPSGSGKSSIVRAGLIPALRYGALPDSDKWFIVEMFPGANPLVELEAALLRIAVNPPVSLIEQLEHDEQGLTRAIKRVLPPDEDIELVLFIDQFEELFTQVQNKELRSHFLDILMAAMQDPRSRLRVIITLRADFYDRPLLYDKLGNLMRERTEVVLPLTADALWRVIASPAEQAGAVVQSGLVETIINDVGEHPGTLPLLQYALTELFEHRQGRMLTIDAYREIGGVTGALARRAEELYQRLDEPAMETARQLFLRLVTLGEGAENTRRRVRRAELPPSDDLDTVIGLYGKYRLLTFDHNPMTREPTVEVAHEALIRTWQRLREWIEDSLEDLRTHRRLTMAATEWDTSGRDSSFLAMGARLTQFESWVMRTDLVLNEDERFYLEASIEQREAQRREEEARQEYEAMLQRRSANRLRAVVVILVIGIVGAFILVGVALGQSQVAQNNAATATFAQGDALLQAETAVAAQGTADANAEIALDNAATATFAQGDALLQAEIAVAAQGTADANAEIALDNAATATFAQGDALLQAETAVAAQGTAGANAEIALNNAATATIAQGEALFQANTAVAAQSTSNANAEIALNNAATATIAQGDALFQASTAVAAQATSNANAEIALNNAATATIAQGDALFQASTAVAAQSTSVANAEIALNNAATATIAQGDALFQASTAVAAQATSNANAEIALNNAATATIAQGDALFQASTAVAAQSTSDANAEIALNNAMTATIAQGDALDQAETAVAAQATSVANADLAATNEWEALSRSTQVAEALATSESSEQLARAQALAVSADQALNLGNTNLALALALESADLNSDLIQAQSVLNRAVNISPVFTVLGLDALPYGRADEDIWNVETNPNPPVVFSPDGRYLLTVDNDEFALYLWDVKTGQLIHRMQGHVQPITSVVFSLDSNRIISGSLDTSAVMWDVETGQELYRLTAHDQPIYVVAMHPNGGSFFTAGDAPPMIRWNMETDEEMARFLQTNREITYLDGFTPDGQFVIMGRFRWNVTTGEMAYASDKEYSGFNRDGRVGWFGGVRIMLENSSDLTGEAISLWNIQNETKVRDVINGFDWRFDRVDFVDFSPDNRTMMIGVDRMGQDEVGNEVFVEDRLVYFDIASGTVLNRYENNDISLVTSAIFMSDNVTVLSTTPDNRLILWDAPTGTILREVGVSDQPLQNLGFDVEENYALTLSADGTASVWDISERETAEVQRIKVTNGVGDIGFSPDGQKIYAASRNEMVSYDLQSGQETSRVYTGNLINSVVFSPTQPDALVSVALSTRMSGNVSVNEGGQVLRWNMDNGEIWRQFGDEDAELCTMSYSPDGRYALMEDQLWDLETGNRLQVLNPDDLRDAKAQIARDPTNTWSCHSTDQWNRAYINLIDTAISPDNQYAVVMIDYKVGWTVRKETSPGVFQQVDEGSAAGDGVYLMSMQTGEQLRRYTGFVSSPTRVDFSPDGSTFAVSLGDPENAIIMFDVETGEIVRRFIGHTSGVDDVVFSPDGLTLLSASDDGSVILWDAATGQPIRTFSGHNNPVQRVAFSPDGRLAISADGQEIIVWRIETLQELIEWTLANRAIQPLTCVQRDQYNVRPLCEEMTPIPTPSVSETPTPVPTSFLRGEVVASGAANVRKEPSPDAFVIGTLPQGTVVDILEIETEWFKILLPDGQEGWISRSLMNRE